MTAPIHTRPFNSDHAKAGAPYCCRNGEEATVLKWDCRDSEFPLGGVFGGQDDATNWNAQGVYNRSLKAEYDLVMLPLGTIDGKPVFVGDEFVNDDGENVKGHPLHSGAVSSRCRWPAPAKVHPETTMTYEEAEAAWGAQPGFSTSLIAIANAALRHAIDAGQVVAAGDRAARDMVIAKAVLEVCKSVTFPMANIDLAAIIAKVEP